MALWWCYTRHKSWHLKKFLGDAAGGKSFQQAVPLKPDPTATVLNQTTAYANIISNAHVDPIPTNLVRFLIENPLGPQLDAAFKALPSITVRYSARPTPMSWLWSITLDGSSVKALSGLHSDSACALPSMMRCALSDAPWYRACDSAGVR